MEQQKLPNGTMIIVLGIFGYLCCCFAGLGIIPSAIAFFMAKKSEKMYAENPEAYDNAGQIDGYTWLQLAVLTPYKMPGKMLWNKYKTHNNKNTYA